MKTLNQRSISLLLVNLFMEKHTILRLINKNVSKSLW